MFDCFSWWFPRSRMPPMLQTCLAPSPSRHQRWSPPTPGTPPTAPAPTWRRSCRPSKGNPSSLLLSPLSPARPPPCPSFTPSSSSMLTSRTPSCSTSTGGWWSPPWGRTPSKCLQPPTSGRCTSPSSGWTTKAAVGAKAGRSPSWTRSLSRCGRASPPSSSSTRRS